MLLHKYFYSYRSTDTAAVFSREGTAEESGEGGEEGSPFLYVPIMVQEERRIGEGLREGEGESESVRFLLPSRVSLPVPKCLIFINSLFK